MNEQGIKSDGTEVAVPHWRGTVFDLTPQHGILITTSCCIFRGYHECCVSKLNSKLWNVKPALYSKMIIFESTMELAIQYFRWKYQSNYLMSAVVSRRRNVYIHSDSSEMSRLREKRQINQIP